MLRSSEKTNYTVWEDLAKFEWYDENYFNNDLKLLYEDFTIESGISYKYAIVKENTYGIRSAPRYECVNDLENAPAHESNFEHSYLYYNGI